MMYKYVFIGILSGAFAHIYGSGSELASASDSPVLHFRSGKPIYLAQKEASVTRCTKGSKVFFAVTSVLSLISMTSFATGAAALSGNLNLAGSPQDYYNNGTCNQGDISCAHNAKSVEQKVTGGILLALGAITGLLAKGFYHVAKESIASLDNTYLSRSSIILKNRETMQWIYNQVMQRDDQLSIALRMRIRFAYRPYVSGSNMVVNGADETMRAIENIDQPLRITFAKSDLTMLLNTIIEQAGGVKKIIIDDRHYTFQTTTLAKYVVALDLANNTQLTGKCARVVLDSWTRDILGNWYFNPARWSVTHEGDQAAISRLVATRISDV